MPVTGTAGILLLVGRVLFGGILAFMGLNHFLRADDMAGYASQKGLPAPRFSVLVSGAVLVLGGLGIMVGMYPVLAAISVGGFLVVSAFLMHDFWAVPEDRQQTEMTQFLKNIVMAGGALSIAAVSAEAWAYSVGVGLF